MNRSSSHQCPLTEYTQQFKKFSVKPRECLRPPQRPRTHDCKTEYKTVNREDYIAHPVSPPRPRPPAIYKRPEGKLRTKTEYRKQYQGQWTHPARTVRPAAARKDVSGPFDHKSTQMIDFVTFPLPPREYHGEKRVYKPPSDTFDGKSTVQSDFVDFGKVDLVPSLKPPQVAKVSTEPFDATTSYRHSFTPLPIPERFEMKREVYKPSEAEFDGTTTFKTDYPAHFGVVRPQSMQPQPKDTASDAPFEGATTSRLSYKRWELPARHTRPQTVYTPPKERFEAQSTFKADYPDYGPVGVVKIVRPRQKPKDQLAPFESLTTQSADFKVWTEVRRPSPICREKKYEPPVEKFDAISTFQAHYRGKTAPRAVIVKPSAATRVETSKMDCSTVYRDSFSREGFKPCPAAFLGESSGLKQEYVFSHQNPTSGHKYYSPVKDSHSPDGALKGSLVAAQV